MDNSKRQSYSNFYKPVPQLKKSECLSSPAMAKPSTLNPQPSTLNPQPSTLNPQPSTLNPQPSTPLNAPQNPPAPETRLGSPVGFPGFGHQRLRLPRVDLGMFVNMNSKSTKALKFLGLGWQNCWSTDLWDRTVRISGSWEHFASTWQRPASVACCPALPCMFWHMSSILKQ